MESEAAQLGVLISSNVAVTVVSFYTLADTVASHAAALPWEDSLNPTLMLDPMSRLSVYRVRSREIMCRKRSFSLHEVFVGFSDPYDVELRALIFNTSGTCLPEDYVRRAADLAVHRLLKFLDSSMPCIRLLIWWLA